MTPSVLLPVVIAWWLAARAVRPTRRRGPSARHWHISARLRRSRLRRAVDRELPDAIDLVVLAVRAGRLPVDALRAVHRHFAPTMHGAVGEVLAAVDTGTRFADALALLPTRLGPALHPLADGLAAADRDGLPLAPLLERLADDARAHRRRLHDAAARQLPVRLSIPLVLCTLPSFVLLAVVPLLLAALSSLHT